MEQYAAELAALMAVFSIGMVVPGADFAIVMRQSIQHGRRAAILTSLGVGSSLLVHVSYTVLGIGLIVSQSLVVFSIVKWVGVAYLTYLGVQALRASASKTPIDTEIGFEATDDRLTRMGDGRAFALGFATNLLNPKAIIFFLSLFTSLVSPTTPMLIQVSYGLAMALALIAWFIGVAVFFTLPSVRASFAQARKWIMRVTGLVFLGLGLKLATERFHD